jgi:hypothetical protein
MGLGCWLSFTWLILSIAVERETKNPRHSGGRGEHGLTPIEAAGRSGQFSRTHSIQTGLNVQRKSPLTSLVMSVLKTVLKLLFVVVVAASIAGIVMLVKRPKDDESVSVDEWPDVPRNPASE